MAKVIDPKWQTVEDYYEGLFIRQDAALVAALEDSAKAGLPEIQVSPAQGKLLELLVRLAGGKKVLEIGTLGGYSAIWMGRGLADGGKLISLELDPRHADLARKNIERAGLAEKAEVRVGRALESLQKLEAERVGPFDLVFIDADKASTAEYFAWAVKLSRRGSLIVVDNVVREGEIVNEKSADGGVAGIRRFNEIAAKDNRVSGTVLQTVGSKGYDGLAILQVV